MLAVLSSLLLAASALNHKKSKRTGGRNAVIKGVCDQTLECARTDLDDKALCSGTYGCLGATINVEDTVTCSGAGGCYRAKFSGIKETVKCMGYKSCERAQGKHKSGDIQGNAIVATKIICNGFQSCSGVKGGIQAQDMLKCDGDLVCSNEKNKKAQAEMDLVSNNKFLCNGRKACYGSKIDAFEGFCDGDAACKTARINADTLRCDGLVSCGLADIVSNNVRLYGDKTAAQATIIPMDTSKDLTVKATGFKAFSSGRIETRGAPKAYIYAYGFAALSSAEIDCKGTECTVVCMMNACKDLVISVATSSSLEITPYDCDPCSPTYAVSKKDPSQPGKAQGVNCPVVKYSGANACKRAQEITAGLFDSYLAEQREIVNAELDEINAMIEQEIDDVLEEISDEFEAALDDVIEDEDILDELALTADVKIPKKEDGLKIKGPCDQTRECEKRVFEAGERAACFGYFGCFKATMQTDQNVKCVGAYSCAKAKLKTLALSVICSGFKSCNGVKGFGKKFAAKFSCNGAFTCNNIGMIAATNIMCDGAAACTNNVGKGKEDNTPLKLFADVVAVAGEESGIRCDGAKACFGNIIKAEETTLLCDGDAACRTAFISVSDLACRGKRVCQATSIKTTTASFSGFFSGLDTVIQPEKKSGSLTVNALGFNSMVDSTIKAQKGQLTLNAYGYRAMVGAVLECAQATCTVTCKGNACKALTIEVDSKTTLTLDPAACDPSDPNYAASKKDSTKGKKVQGVYCPWVKTTQRVQAEIEWDAETQQTINEVRQEAQQFTALHEAEIDAGLQDLEIDYDVDEEEMDDIEEETEQEQEMFVAASFHDSGKTLVASNLITALCVFVACAVAAFVYAVYKNKKTGEFKPLLQ